MSEENNETRTIKMFRARNYIIFAIETLLIIGYGITIHTYNVFRGAFEASIAVNQVEDSVIQYSLIQQLINNDMAGTLITSVFFVMIVMVILPFIYDLFLIAFKAAKPEF